MRWSKIEATIEAAAWLCAFAGGLVIGLVGILWLQWSCVVLVGLVAAMAAGLYWIERSGR